MRVIMKRQRDGVNWRKHFYGQYEVDGKRFVVNTNILWQGKAPVSLRGSGDVVFERSRAKAEAELQRIVDEANHRGRADHLMERLIQSKTGQVVKHARIADLHGKWMQGGEYSAGYIAQCKAIFTRFVEFVNKHAPSSEFVYQVTPALTDAFMDEIRKTMSRSTANAYIGILRPAFDLCLPSGAQNPFRVTKRRKKKTAADAKEGKGFHRQPFTAKELEALLEASQSDPMMHDLITVCACTGMRRGDVCSLQWDAVDLKEGVVTAKASKTGETVEVPIFSPLRAVLESRIGNNSHYVFPEAARILQTNPDNLTLRFKKIIVQALSPQKKQIPDAVFPPDLERKGKDAIMKGIVPGARRDRILDSFGRYCRGASIKEIVRVTGRALSTTSGDMATVEKLLGYQFVRKQEPSLKHEIDQLTRAPRSRGVKSASIRDWHALRTTFVTLALSAGVDVELVKRVTGHKTTAIVLEHYFRPDRKTFKAAFAEALPDVLTGGHAGNVSDAQDQTDKELAVLLKSIQEGKASAKDRKRFKNLAAKIA